MKSFLNNSVKKRKKLSHPLITKHLKVNLGKRVKLQKRVHLTPNGRHIKGEKPACSRSPQGSHIKQPKVSKQHHKDKSECPEKKTLHSATHSKSSCKGKDYYTDSIDPVKTDLHSVEAKRKANFMKEDFRFEQALLKIPEIRKKGPKRDKANQNCKLVTQSGSTCRRESEEKSKLNKMHDITRDRVQHHETKVRRDKEHSSSSSYATSKRDKHNL